MKKALLLGTCLTILLLCSCDTAINTDTQFYFDTAVTLTAKTNAETLEAAMDLCRKYDKLWGKENKESEIFALNNTDGETTVSKDTAKLIERGLYFGNLSGGRFDISIYPLSKIWDIKNQVIPSRDEIAEALKNVDYESVDLSGTTVNPNGKKIDVGGIAKGFIADELLSFFKSKNVSEGIINLGGNVVVFGDRDYNVGIKKPFSENENSTVLKVKNKSIVTSGVYERSFYKDGNFYHHIIDPKTGYPAETDLYSAVIINDSSLDGDALSTTALLLGREKATDLIESIKGTEAIFIDSKNEIYLTSGLCFKGDYVVFK